MSNYAIIDKRTGEIVIDNAMFIGKKPHYVDRGFVKIFVAFLKDVVENPKIAGKSIRLLFYMLEQLDYNTYTMVIIPKYAMKALNISEKTFYNWVSDLVSEGIVSKIDRYTYKLNPYVAVKGNSKKAMDNEFNMLDNELSMLNRNDNCNHDSNDKVKLELELEMLRELYKKTISQKKRKKIQKKIKSLEKQIRQQ